MELSMAKDLEAALIDGGITPSAAKILANAIDNAATGVVTSGRQVVDNTPVQKMRQINAADRTLLFSNLDYPTEALAERMKVSAGLQRDPRQHPYLNSQPASGDPTIATGSVRAGQFVKVERKTTDKVAQSEVSLEVEDQGGSHARTNAATGKVESVPFLVRFYPQNLIEGAFVEEDGRTVLEIRLKNLDEAGRITGFGTACHTSWRSGTTCWIVPNIS